MSEQLETEGYQYFMSNYDKDDPEREPDCKGNPYICGPNYKEEALKWWKGFDKARTEIRLAPKPKKQKQKTSDLPGFILKPPTKRTRVHL